MSRQAARTADELRSLIVDAASEIVVEEGIDRLTARSIAKRINYSPAMLYNAVDGMDGIVLAVEGRVLDRLADTLAKVPTTGEPIDQIKLLLSCYLKFATENRALWSPLLEHRLSSGRDVPAWYKEKLVTLVDRFCRLMPPPEAVRRDENYRKGLTLWVVIHGMSAVVVNPKSPTCITEDIDGLIGELVDTYVAGLFAKAQT